MKPHNVTKVSTQEMKSITIDISRFIKQYHREPERHEVATWTFAIDGDPILIYGSYAEAISTVRLCARLRDDEIDAITLVSYTRSGTVRAYLN